MQYAQGELSPGLYCEAGIKLEIAVHIGCIPVWTVFFMKKLIRFAGVCGLLAALVWCGSLVADRVRLNEELIRLHVVGASDSQEDQALKLLVRDAVTEGLAGEMADITDVAQAEAWLRENLDRIEETANGALQAAGCGDTVTVTLGEEAFDTRYYDTFALPAGVYQSLRITIGEGQGRNWWCVVFPTLCMGATSEEFQDTAAGAGFPESLSGALTGEEEYEIRFFLLDALGKLENLLHKG